MQNLVVLMEPSDDAWNTSLRGGNMILNRFCIDEDAAFELAGVSYVKKTSEEMRRGESPEFKEKRKEKGKEYSFFTILLYFEELNFEKLDVNFNEQLIILPKKNNLTRKLLILHYKIFLKTWPKNLKYTLFMLVTIIII